MWTKFPLKNVVFVKKKKKSFLFDSNTTFSVVFVSNTTLVVISFKILGIFFYFFAKHWEYTKFISKVRRNLWHQDDLILNPLQLLKLWLGVKVRVRVPFAWSCREDMLCWWPWPPYPFQYRDKDIHTYPGRHNLKSFLAANSTQNYFLIAHMLSFLWHSRPKWCI